jgi:hypothetical protein
MVLSFSNGFDVIFSCLDIIVVGVDVTFIGFDVIVNGFDMIFNGFDVIFVMTCKPLETKRDKSSLRTEIGIESICHDIKSTKYNSVYVSFAALRLQRRLH